MAEGIFLPCDRLLVSYEQEIMADPVKGLGKVHSDDVGLFTLLSIF